MSRAGARAFRGEIVEACLAHATGGAVELAYRRTAFLEKRRELMAEQNGVGAPWALEWNLYGDARSSRNP